MDIKLYETARRDLIRLWAAKRHLLLAAQARFPKSYPALTAIQKVCHNDPTCQIRFLADKSACQCADRYGDEIFRKEVDGVKLPAVTHWFYGFSSHIPEERIPWDRSKTFRASDIHRLELVRTLARVFIASVAALPFVSAKELSRETKKFERAFDKARSRAEECSPLYTAYLYLVGRLPHGIPDNVIAFSE